MSEKRARFCDRCEKDGRDTLAVERIEVSTMTSGRHREDVCQDHYDAVQRSFTAMGIKLTKSNKVGGKRAGQGELVEGSIAHRTLTWMKEQDALGGEGSRRIVGGEDIEAALGNITALQARSALTGLHSSGHIERVARGRYRTKAAPVSIEQQREGGHA